LCGAKESLGKVEIVLKALSYSAAISHRKLYPPGRVWNCQGDTASRGNIRPDPGGLDATQKARQTGKGTENIAKFVKLADDALNAGIKMRQADEQENLIKELEKWVSCPVLRCLPRKRRRTCSDRGAYARSSSKILIETAAPSSSTRIRTRNCPMEKHTRR
jgi:hypothetical protein